MDSLDQQFVDEHITDMATLGAWIADGPRAKLRDRMKSLAKMREQGSPLFLIHQQGALVSQASNLDAALQSEIIGGILSEIAKTRGQHLNTLQAIAEVKRAWNENPPKLDVGLDVDDVVHILEDSIIRDAMTKKTGEDLPSNEDPLYQTIQTYVREKIKTLSS